MARSCSYLWSKNKHTMVVSFCSWQFDVHKERQELSVTNGWPSITVVYLRKGSMIAGIRAFQPAHTEIDLLVGQEVWTRSSMAPHDMSSSSNVNTSSSDSIGSTSGNSSVQRVVEAASMPLSSDGLSSEGWAASKSPSSSRSFCHLDACSGTEAMVQDFFLSRVLLGLVKCRPIPMVVTGWDNWVSWCTDIVK